MSSDKQKAKQWIKDNKKAIKAVLKITSELGVIVSYSVDPAILVPLLTVKYKDHCVTTSDGDDEYYKITFTESR